MARILIIDDEPETLSALEERLRAVGHDVTSTRRGREGLRLARDLHPDLVLLDLVLPDVSGTEVCRSLRGAAEGQGQRVMIVSARSDEIDKVVGFELGIDDYVVKPFSVRELMLRVRAVLRRGERRDPSAPSRIELGSLRIDRDAHRIRVAGNEVSLTALEFRLLILDFARGGKPVRGDARVLS